MNPCTLNVISWFLKDCFFKWVNSWRYAWALVVARLDADNHAHRVRREAAELERDIAGARAELRRRLPPAAARAVYLSRALQRAHAAEGARRCGGAVYTLNSVYP
jgi:hypothetical protein